MLGLHMLMTLYDILHYYFHFSRDTCLPILAALKKNHLKHHFKNANAGFGVTTTLWDRVCGTQFNK
jgi:4-hydroxysphinganine ceramide fatty acyl 2-hydroxylase